jgi:hypothetical protein
VILLQLQLLQICKSRFAAVQCLGGTKEFDSVIRRGFEMTAEKTRAAIKKMIKQHTKTVTTSKKKARDSLIKEGFYTAEGKLTEEYGGEAKSAA